MDNIYIEKYADTSIRLSNLDTLTPRAQTKIKLFLKAAFPDTNIIAGEKELLLNYVSWTPYEIGKDLVRITNFFTSSDMKFTYGDYIQEIMENYNTMLKQENNKKEILTNLKISNFQNENEYKNFKNFCDNALKINLRSYQYESAYLLSIAKTGFDFSVPGSGKTIITYAVFCYFKSQNYLKKILIIGPKTAYNAWYDEYETCFAGTPKFENLSNNNILYAKNYFMSSLRNHKEVTFINIEKIRSLKKEIINFLTTSDCLLVIDEAHKVKNPLAKSTQVALALAKHTNYKILLTGTPMPNGYEDLFSLTTIISPNSEILPYSFSQLKSFSQNGIAEEQEKKIIQSISPFYSRVSKKYLIERKELLSPKINFSFVEMDSQQREVYEFLNDLAADVFNRWELEFSFIMAKAIMIRKMQVSSNPRLLNKSLLSVYENAKRELYNYDEDYDMDFNQFEDELRNLEIAGKIIDKEIAASSVGSIIKDYNRGKFTTKKNQKAVEITNNLLKEGKKVILWDTFVDNMRCIQEMIFKQLNVSVKIINGNVVGEERQNIINEFRRGKLRVLIASPATLAESISLHKCCQNAIYVNRNYNAAQFIQSKDRIHRINMPLNTTANYNFLINVNSVDEAINERLELKEQRMLKILDSDNIIIGDLEEPNNCTVSKEDVEKSFLT